MEDRPLAGTVARRPRQAAAVAIGLLCYIVALNVTASAAHVHPVLGMAVLVVIALVAAALTATRRGDAPTGSAPPS